MRLLATNILNDLFLDALDFRSAAASLAKNIKLPDRQRIALHLHLFIFSMARTLIRRQADRFTCYCSEHHPIRKTCS